MNHLILNFYKINLDIKHLLEYDAIMSDKIFLTTSEVAKLLHINEKKIYTLAQEGIIPATKSTGKWLFPYNELIDFLKYDSLKNIKKGLPFSLLEQDTILGAGSDDILLQKIFSKFHDRSNTTLFYSTVGSEPGIIMLKNRIIHFALSHIYDYKEKEFNLPFIKKIFPFKDYVIINLFTRDIGIISNFKISSLKDFTNKKLTFVLRQKGSGIRHLTDNLFFGKDLDKKNFNFYPEEINTHFDTAIMVKSNKDFIGITTKSVANLFNLNFFHIFNEQFDIITLKQYFFNKTFQKFNKFISQNLKNEFKTIEGYNFSQTGTIKV